MTHRHRDLSIDISMLIVTTTNGAITKLTLDVGSFQFPCRQSMPYAKPNLKLNLY